MGPVIEGIPQQVGHGGGPLVELLSRRGVARAEPFRHPVAAHGAPLVVVARQPHLCHVGKAPILGHLAGRQMAVIVDDR